MDVARLLVTGFEPFPGAPVNPTERLVAEWRAKPPALDGVGAFRAEVLPVDYAAVGPRLSEIGRSFRPNIAIHFGLAGECSGFRLERVARNRFAAGRPDNSGAMRADVAICAAPEIIPSGLPLAEIERRLGAAGLPVEWSDDAGGYLCNMVMTLSLAHACDGFAPSMSGFMHVPPAREAEPGNARAMAHGDLKRGAEIVAGACVEAWRAGRAVNKHAPSTAFGGPPPPLRRGG